MVLLVEGIWIICKALLKGSQYDRMGRKFWLGCPDWIASSWTLLFWKKTSAVLPRLNVSLSHLHLDTQEIRKHLTSLYLWSDFTIPGEEGLDLTAHWKPRYRLISLPYLVIFEEWLCIPWVVCDSCKLVLDLAWCKDLHCLLRQWQVSRLLSCDKVWWLVHTVLHSTESNEGIKCIALGGYQDKINWKKIVICLPTKHLHVGVLENSFKHVCAFQT